MKKRDPKKCIKYLGLFILLFSMYNCNAQDDANSHPKPFMWTAGTGPLKDKFNSIKKPKLDSYYPGVKQPDSFILENFLGMMKYFSDRYKDTFKCLHVYIAAYSKNDSPRVPKDYGDKLMLIFAPANGYSSAINTDLGYYAFPPDTPFDEKNLDVFKVDDVQKEWRENYTSKLMKSILKTIDPTDENMIDGKLSDTRCITYCSQDILELVAEQGYTHINSSNKKIEFSDSMKVSFAAFGKEGNTRRKNTGKKRLFVLFDFLDKNGKVIFLSNTKGFSGRSPSDGTCTDCLPPSFLKVYSGDNGTLCPPCVNCPTGTPGCDKKNP